MPPPTLAESTGRPATNEVRTLVEDCLRIVKGYRLPLTKRECRRIVVTFLATGKPLSELHAWVIAYADPTGETAVRNVQRERGF